MFGVMEGQGCVSRAVLVTVPTEASSLGASKGSFNPEEDRELSQVLEEVAESSQAPGVEALCQRGPGAAQVLGLT